MIKNISGQIVKAHWQHNLMTSVEGATIHYAAGSPVAPKYQNEQQLINLLNSYARWHISHIGNDSIAYTFVVDKYGDLYRVRDRDRISWHTGNGWGNTKTLGVLLPLGTSEEPTVDQTAGMYRLLDYMISFYGLKRSNIVGHKELRSTECPGKAFPYVLQYRSMYLFRPGFYTVIQGGSATIRSQPNRNGKVILTLPPGYPEYIHAEVEGEKIGASSKWYVTQSDYGTGYIHSSGLQGV